MHLLAGLAMEEVAQALNRSVRPKRMEQIDEGGSVWCSLPSSSNRCAPAD